MKIGIPRALMFYRYFPLWRHMLEANNHEIVLSPRPQRGFLVGRTIPGAPDLCLPVKLMLLHVDALKDCCDAIFIPRLISFDKNTYNCPHFLGIPDVVRAHVDRRVRILDPTFDVKNRSRPEKDFYHELSTSIHCPVSFDRMWPQATMALRQANRRFPSRTDPRFFNQISFAEANNIVALIGRPYILYEPELGGKLFSFFSRERLFLLTPEMIGTSVKNRAIESLIRPIFWYNGRENVSAAFSMLKNDKIDGVIQVVTFGCGPDSLMKEMIDQAAAIAGAAPYLSLVLDQHTTGEGLQTRLEAFIDMIRRRKRNRSLNRDQ